MNTMVTAGPLGGLRVNFGAYVERMRRKDDAHRINGIPDYAFALDYTLREQIRKLPFFYTLSKKVAIQAEARFRQQLTASGVQAGPRQFPEIYEMTLACAKRLGIGSPNVFVLHDQSINAATYASDTVSPTIYVTSGAVERLTPGELKCVIGHECGHVHNEHMVYQSIADLVMAAIYGSAGLLGGLLPYLSEATVILFYEWMRAAEVTCDRAGMICGDNVEDAIGVNKKLAYGSFLNQEIEVDIEELRAQFGDLSAVASVFTEIGKDHPSSIRRVLTSEAFTHCDILYLWRPELKKPGMALRSKTDVDAECEKYVAVIKEARGVKKG